MIISLCINNVALIDKVEIEFGEGLNILTGETGAGKSILIDSINFMLGERPGKDFIRSGATSALVEGILQVTDADCLQGIRDMGVEIEDDGQLMVSRTLNMAGRSVSRLNGNNVTVGVLKGVSAFLVDVHGQHQHQSLLNANQHIVLLDRFCGEQLEILKKELAILIAEYRKIGKELKALQGVPGQREAQMEIWKFQVNEISKAKLNPGEEAELLQRRNRLSEVDSLATNTNEALSLLYGNDSDSSLSAADQVNRAVKLINEIAEIDESKAYLAEKLSEAATLINDITEDLTYYIKEIDADPQALERMEYRLDTIYKLKKKYGGTEEDILRHLKDINGKLERLANLEDEIADLNHNRREAIKKIAAVCDKMTALRRNQAEKIQGRIVNSLRELGMKNVQFAIAMEKQAAFTASGNDKLEMMISPNLGESLKPLSQIASGGEMSRVMLALKAVITEVDRISTLIFDEIDSGVSGRTAQKVAEKMVQISGKGKCQLICITHLPQIAAMADIHLLITKGEEAGHTLTRVTNLDIRGSINELARLIGGAEITEATFEAAREMKDMAAHVKLD